VIGAVFHGIAGFVVNLKMLVVGCIYKGLQFYPLAIKTKRVAALFAISIVEIY
jgi:hypothetical protein